MDRKAGSRPLRIIPADAGSTISGLHVARANWDHPRGCGEHHSHDRCQLVTGGSSPRMRGARWVPLGQMDPVGIIPADAGSTKAPAGCPRQGEDHPRGCGEHHYSSSSSFP